MEQWVLMLSNKKSQKNLGLYYDGNSYTEFTKDIKRAKRYDHIGDAMKMAINLNDILEHTQICVDNEPDIFKVMRVYE